MTTAETGAPNRAIAAEPETLKGDAECVGVPRFRGNALPQSEDSLLQRAIECDACRLLFDATSTQPVSRLIEAMFDIGMPQVCAKRLAVHLSVSRATLHRICHRDTGRSLRVLIDQARLAVVLTALATHESRARDLARCIGYVDTASLRRVVRRSAGMPLAAVRQHLRDEGALFARQLIQSHYLGATNTIGAATLLLAADAVSVGTD
jgi:AraC-like DNA-binding protein